MPLFTRENFEKLAAEKGKTCISIYIPTHRMGENQDSMIRLKNAISEADNKLSEMGLKEKERKKLLAPIGALLDDTKFWRYLSDALMIFRSSEEFFHTTLPATVREITMVSNRFYLLPLIPVLNRDDKFYILQLSLKMNRLFEATQYEVTEIETSGYLPDGIEDSVGTDVEQKNLQFRSGQSDSGQGMFHGHGAGKDDRKVEISKYLHEVSDGLSKLIKGENIPLVVASVEYLAALFKQHSHYKNIVEDTLKGNFDHTDPVVIHQEALGLVKEKFEARHEKKKQAYFEKSEHTTSKIDELVVAAEAGMVDTLFVQKAKKLPGAYEKDTGEVVIKKNGDTELPDTCLLDLAAKSTYLQGGKVYLEAEEEMPDEEMAVAILRY